jgi:uncharacterized lipoprotein
MPILKCLLLSLLLVACSAGKDPRYVDTSVLESPPKLTTEQTKLQDISVEPAQKLHKGLRDKVTWLSEPPTIVLKQAPAEAWQTLEHALRQNLIKITDRERDKGRYYVLYKADSFFNRKRDPLTYNLSLNPDGEATKISAAVASDIEKDVPQNDSEALLRTLYDMLKNHLSEE